jgi:hypothetical protein
MRRIWSALKFATPTARALPDKLTHVRRPNRLEQLGRRLLQQYRPIAGIESLFGEWASAAMWHVNNDGFHGL